MLLSIIIPTFNDGKYIERCVNSVGHLKLDDYEIVIIVDGSTDDTLAILENISLRNHRIRVIRKNNEGLRKARIDGLKEANGKYITFLDGDDWIDDGYLESFVRRMEDDEQLDACIGAIVRNYVDGSESEYHKIGEDKHIYGENILKEMIFGREFRWELCAKVYRKKIFNRYLPQNDIRICEDLDWNWELFKDIKKVFYSSEHKYHYYANPRSMTSKTGIAVFTQHQVYKRILDDEATCQGEYKEYFSKAYAKMIPRLLLELITAGKHSDSEIGELQSGFKSVEASLVDKEEYFDKKMVSALEESKTSCVDYFKSYVESLKRDLENIGKEYRKVYLYGTGFITSYILRWKDIFPITISGIVVSEGHPNCRLFFGHEVLYVSELQENPKDCCFVITLVKDIQPMVEEYLSSNGFNNFYRMNVEPFSDG